MTTRRQVEDVKIAALGTGVRVSPDTLDRLRTLGPDILSVHEYPTTGGLTLELPDGVFLNAPFDDWYCIDATVELTFDDDVLLLRSGDTVIPVVRFIPLPAYLDDVDSRGRPVTDVLMSHVDRARVSPILGCTYDCAFCDLPAAGRGVLRPAEQMIEALDVAKDDRYLPVRHALISGGSPRAADYDAFEAVCLDVVRGSPLPIEIMMSPMINNLGFVDRAVAAGVAGFSINLELQSERASLDILGKKYRVTRPVFAEFVGRAVELLGRAGAVRSLIIPGLEPVEDTLAGVDFIASLGCWPVLSPFRPAPGTRLFDASPTSAAIMRAVLDGARDIVRGHGVSLGPVCTACQHNTLSFPWDC